MVELSAESVKLLWFNIFKQAPLISSLKNTAPDTLKLLAFTEVHVGNIDVFVKALETNLEAKAKFLRVIQGKNLVLVISISSLLMCRVYVNMVQPLREVVAAVQKIKKGDFSTKVHCNTSDELDLLAKTLNLMSVELESLYKNLEVRVEK